MSLAEQEYIIRCTFVALLHCQFNKIQCDTTSMSCNIRESSMCKMCDRSILLALFILLKHTVYHIYYFKETLKTSCNIQCKCVNLCGFWLSMCFQRGCGFWGGLDEENMVRRVHVYFTDSLLNLGHYILAGIIYGEAVGSLACHMACTVLKITLVALCLAS